MERCRSMLSFDSPLPLHTFSISNWVDSNGAIEREESQFLNREQDLLTVSPLEDGVHHWLERFISASLSWISIVIQSAESSEPSNSEFRRKLISFCQNPGPPYKQIRRSDDPRFPSACYQQNSPVTLDPSAGHFTSRPSNDLKCDEQFVEKTYGFGHSVYCFHYRHLSPHESKDDRSGDGRCNVSSFPKRQRPPHMHSLRSLLILCVDI